MEPLWRTPDGLLLSRRRPQYLPYLDGPDRARVEGSFDHVLLDPTTGEVRQRFVRSCAGEPDGSYRWTHHLVEDGSLVEVTVHVPDTASFAPVPVRVLGTAVLIADLVPYEGPRWRTVDGRVLVQGAPLTRTYGGDPPFELVEGAHDYDLVDGESGAILVEYRGSDVVLGASDNEVLTRYVVEGSDLVEVVFHYHEDSCWGVGRIDGVSRKTVLDGLVPARGEASRPGR